jgi:hypothetical protein
MPRITLEDIKLNKTRRPETFSKRVVLQNKIKEEKENEKKVSEKRNFFGSESTPKQRIERTPQVKTRRRIISTQVFTFFILFVIFGGIYWAGEKFQRADVEIKSKHQIINYVNKEFTASKSSGSGNIDFEIMIIEDKVTKKIILTEPEDVSLKAKGSVTLYNEYSKTGEKIVAGTFIADKAGKTYKTDSTVTIPGYKIENKKIIPGQTTVNITAFLPGATYNGSFSDFFFTSFKGTAKYNKIYGKLKTPISGGASGLVYKLNDDDKAKLNNIAEMSFKDDLIEKVYALVPPGFILYKNAVNFFYKINDSVLSEKPETDIEIEGTVSVLLLKEKSLLDNIIKISLPDIKGEELKEINIMNLKELSFLFKNSDQQISKEIETIPFILTGGVNVVWKPDLTNLKMKLAGLNKNSVLPVFRQDPGISSAIVKILPPWHRYLPENNNKIYITVDE